MTDGMTDFEYMTMQRDELLALLLKRGESIMSWSIMNGHLDRAAKDDDSEWRDVLCIHTSVGKLTYHISPANMKFFKRTPRNACRYDCRTWHDRSAKLKALRD